MKIKIKILKKYNAIIAGILTLLGFSSACTYDIDEEYGPPSALYILKGNVTSAKNDQPIEGIEVNLYGRGPVTTDRSGDYEIISNSRESPTICPINFKDIDGETNGAFNDLDTTIDFINAPVSEDNGFWDEDEVKELNVKLTSKDGSN